ncbi:hypothetical protein EV361DRAFT_904866 [Lentinula raphanica]|uniref:Uncharacterized protein n=1 Tax=Lentinula raphanica TaxID=153919 RepID=A0AA38UHL2_9AGAR|nr:hypothetical protein F5878DRAFT_610102 [Lentinula raphanica]KAJ3972568.1 hypothetical protein EV361DRAFT_904866 [Lentinula raphanica]
MNLKRKRAEGYDSDDDELSFGRQILPVANLPDSFDGIPSDGMEYLFTVRRDARKLPHVFRVPNPYQAEDPILPPPRSLETTHPSLPSPEWRSLLEIRFRNLRKNIAQPTNTTASSSKQRMPELKDRSAWWDFLAGKPESVWNPPKKPKALKQTKYGRGMRAFQDNQPASLDYSVASTHEDIVVSQPQASQVSAVSVISAELPDDITLPGSSLQPHTPVVPTPLILGQVDDRMALHLLMYFTYWINQHLTPDRQPPFPRPTQAHLQWIFALLTRVEDYISADDMNLLRKLARACIALLKTFICERTFLIPDSGVNGDNTPDKEEKNNATDQAACWMIISVVIGIWGQRDLWLDAEDMLKNL